MNIPIPAETPDPNIDKPTLHPPNRTRFPSRNRLALSHHRWRNRRRPCHR
jgi:hypothetical protein